MPPLSWGTPNRKVRQWLGRATDAHAYLRPQYFSSYSPQRPSSEVLREHPHHPQCGAFICNHVDALAHIAKTILQGAARARPAPTAWCCKSTCTCTRQCKHVQGGETWSTPSSVVACYLLCPTHHMSSALKYGSQDTSARCPMRGRREACRAFALSTR